MAYFAFFAVHWRFPADDSCEGFVFLKALDSLRARCTFYRLPSKCGASFHRDTPVLFFYYYVSHLSRKPGADWRPELRCGSQSLHA